MRQRLIELSAGAGMSCLAACSGGAGVDGPLELRFAADGEPTAYVATYEQDIEWGSAHLERRYGIRYTLDRADGSRVAVHLDSLGLVVSTPHGRQALDTRHLVGSEFELAIDAIDGRPTYPADTPLLEMPGVLEGEVSIRRLMDFGFPELPDGPIQVGDRWTAQSTRPQVEAHVAATAVFTTDYHFSGWETIDGVDCARIEANVAAEVSVVPYDLHGATVEFAGTLAGDLTWFFDPSTEVLVRLTGETLSDGMLTVAGNATPIEQSTRIRIEKRDAS